MYVGTLRDLYQLWSKLNVSKSTKKVTLLTKGTMAGQCFAAEAIADAMADVVADVAALISP